MKVMALSSSERLPVEMAPPAGSIVPITKKILEFVLHFIIFKFSLNVVTPLTFAATL
jgi:hypothetical protein